MSTNPCFLYPVRFETAAFVLVVEHGGLSEYLPFPATGSITVGRDYWLAGDATIDDATGNADLVSMLETALNANTVGATYAVSISATNQISISSTHSFKIKWADVGTTLDGSIFGAVADDPDPAATSTTIALTTRGIWSPTYPAWSDSREQQPISGGFSRSVSGLVRSSFFGLLNKERDLSWDMLQKSKTLREYRDGTIDTEGTLEDLWLLAGVLGRRVRYYADAADRTAFESYRFRDASHPFARSEHEQLRWRGDFRLVSDTGGGTFTSGGSGGSSGSGIPTTRAILTGSGLTGGGDLSIDRTHSLDVDGLTEEFAPTTAADFLAIYSSGGSVHKKVLIDNLGISNASAVTVQIVDNVSASAASNSFVRVKTDVSAATITLPDSALSVGELVEIKAVHGHLNAVTVSAAGVDMIDDVATQTLSTQNAALVLRSDGLGNWGIL